MSLFRFTFLRKFIRRHTKPIPEDDAAKWQKRLSLGYAIVAWNAFGFVCYQVYKGKADWAQYHGLKTEEELKMTPAQQWSKTLGIKKAEVYRITGFNVSHYTINEEKEKTEEVST
ncbi:hypothetical protein HHI36_001606 [Cryptolaemus montrouzieri]|uniref:Uncharacterized protein n=1 Tax=Cryptolaemus montrouzieri TaxID=559131 RepID=A0ABD2P8F0_9CUCU